MNWHSLCEPVMSDLFSLNQTLKRGDFTKVFESFYNGVDYEKLQQFDKYGVQALLTNDKYALLERVNAGNSFALDYILFDE